VVVKAGIHTHRCQKCRKEFVCHIIDGDCDLEERPKSVQLVFLWCRKCDPFPAFLKATRVLTEKDDE